MNEKVVLFPTKLTSHIYSAFPYTRAWFLRGASESYIALDLLMWLSTTNPMKELSGEWAAIIITDMIQVTYSPL